MPHRMHLLGVNLLSKLHGFFRSLGRHVLKDVLTFLLGGFQYVFPFFRS
jgi:hypothetical protein